MTAPQRPASNGDARKRAEAHAAENDERTVVVTYTPGTATVRSMRPDSTSARADADALRRAADVIDGWVERDAARVIPPGSPVSGNTTVVFPTYVIPPGSAAS